MTDVVCSRCHKRFVEEPVGCITAKMMGDEITDCYYWCAACGVYTIDLIRDVFVGEETSHGSDPIPKEEGDRRLTLIRSCTEPWDGSCRCPGHRAYFGDSLD